MLVPQRSSLGVTLVLAACAGVSPRPEDLATRELPLVNLTAAARADVDALQRSALQALAERRFDDAEQAAALAVERDPRAARARAVLGHALLQRSKVVDPPDLFLQNRGDGETLSAVRVAPADPVVGRLRGRFLTDTGHLSAAADAAEECLRRIAANADSEYLDLVAAAAEWCHELGEERRALPHLRVLAGQRTEDAKVQFQLGACLLRTAEEPATPAEAARAAEAAKAFARCTTLAPDDAAACLAIAAAYARAAELAHKAGEDADAFLRDAAAACAAAAARFPTLAEPWFRSGVVAERRGDAAAAQDAYDQVLQRDAGHLGALLNLAALLAAAVDNPARAQRARELWRRALAVDASKGGLRPGERARIAALLTRP